MIIEHICPSCESELAFDDSLQEIICPHCQTEILVNYDADFVAGRFVDRTTLSIKNQ